MLFFAEIMVIGAYIVTSYFIFVEKHPNTKKEDIYEAIEDTLSKVIEAEDFELEDPNLRKTNFEFKLADLLDSKSAAFIQKFDIAMTKLFTDDK